jgi:hypothetical protein
VRCSRRAALLGGASRRSIRPRISTCRGTGHWSDRGAARSRRWPERSIQDTGGPMERRMIRRCGKGGWRPCKSLASVGRTRCQEPTDYHSDQIMKRPPAGDTSDGVRRRRASHGRKSTPPSPKHGRMLGSRTATSHDRHMDADHRAERWRPSQTKENQQTLQKVPRPGYVSLRNRICR